jgi:osmotically-inducible protein OsmY
MDPAGGGGRPPSASLPETAEPPPATTSALTDETIADAIRTELKLDGVTPIGSTNVVVHDGVVQLTGTVESLLARRRAVRIAEMVRGVRTVSSRIQVSPDPLVPDRRIVHDVADAWRWDAAADGYELDVTVADGVATLTGAVGSWAERSLAEAVAASVRGVIDIDNQIRIQYEAERADAELKAEIEARLTWDVLVNEHGLSIDVSDAKVTMSGTVGSAAERRRAAGDAWVRGVDDVDASNVRVTAIANDPRLRETAFERRADPAIRHAIELAAAYDPRVSSFDLEPEVAGGVVTLRGNVDNLKAKQAAEQIARHTLGVVHVIDRIEVVSDGEDADSDLATSIGGRLQTNPYTDSYQIRVDVDDGWATLTGTVDTFLEKAEAEDVAARARGVVAVVNKLQVSDPSIGFYSRPYLDPYHPYIHPRSTYAPSRTSASDADLERDIRRELFWSPFVDENEIIVDVEGGVATLTGNVDSWRERDAATENAYEGGALRVDNRLHVEARP